MGAVETRPSRKMPIRILGVFFATLHFITSSNHGLQRKREDYKDEAPAQALVLRL